MNNKIALSNDKCVHQKFLIIFFFTVHVKISILAVLSDDTLKDYMFQRFNMAQILSWYLIALGSGLILFSIVEFFIPQQIFNLWKKWIACKLFPIHGRILSSGALPLTFFRDSIAGKIMMGIGIIAVFTGPFILFFPGRIRELFALTEKELEEGDEKGLIYFDAAIRMTVGFLIIFTILHYGVI